MTRANRMYMNGDEVGGAALVRAAENRGYPQSVYMRGALGSAK